MKLRKYQTEDQEEKKEVHRKSIREVASNDYSKKQIDAWSDFSDYGKIEENVERWVAEKDGKIVGFSDYRIDTGEVTGVYVHPEYTEQGIGSKLLEKIIQDAKQRGFNELSCEASITAKDFYKKHGFQVVEEVIHETNGVEMGAYKMKKNLST